MTEDEVQAEIARLTAEIDQLNERRVELRKLLSFPTVTPVLVYWRYSRKYEDPGMADNTLEQAAGVLQAMADDGSCSPEGVSVGGALLPMDELRERFPRLDDL